MVVPSAHAEEGTIDYARDVLPILSDRCFLCHGPDEGRREADLRLDDEAAAKAWAIVPGEPNRSELVSRIESDDADLQMPPPESKLSLTKKEREILKRWIAEGAPWGTHWGFRTPEATEPPKLDKDEWSRNGIDRFILKRLNKEGFAPSKTADRETLIRRVTFDLTGLPPTIEEVQAFAGDTRPDAYERLVDRLLASDRFGERMAVDWLDLARYADTYGYQSDVYREVWPYRDWVIRSFNENLPYDEFITAQLAGDLLPNASRDQILATAFNRLHRQTNEGGSIEREWRIEYVADRVNTFGAAFLGLTLECARCHDHKYDPITQRDYYQFASFFNSIDESGLYSHFTSSVPTPTLLLTDHAKEQQLRQLATQIETQEQQLRTLRESRREAFLEWNRQRVASPSATEIKLPEPLVLLDFEKSVRAPNTSVPSPRGQGVRLTGDDGIGTKVGNFKRSDPFSVSLWVNTPDVKERAVLFHRSRAWTDAGSRGYEMLIEEGKLSFALVHFWPGNAIRVRSREPLPTDEWKHIAVTYDGSREAKGITLYIDGEPIPVDIVRDHLTKQITGGGGDTIAIGQRFRDRGFKNGSVDEFRVDGRELSPVEVNRLASGSADDAKTENATPTEEEWFTHYLLTVDPEANRLRTEIQQKRVAYDKVVDGIKEIMVMREMETPRPTHLLTRGAYDSPAERVSRSTPESLPGWNESWPRNRLGLAKWLTDSQHPLTSRVAVNRLWQQMFGRGLVGTPEDFGRQGELPTHPILLDWLSQEFIASGWDTKAMLKRIAMSATYRQTSDADADRRASDPENRLLSRGPSRRLSAEMIRDAALFASGLLVDQQGGPSVKPYQPPGLWAEKSGARYKRDAGPGSHRRSLYTYWKRTSPPPSMLLFDATPREVCVAQRQVTATPLQVLVLLNDPQYVEAAKALANRLVSETDGTPQQVLPAMFQALTARTPTEREAKILRGMFTTQKTQFTTDLDAAKKLLSVGDAQVDPNADPATLAAWTVIAQALMAYDGFVMSR